MEDKETLCTKMLWKTNKNFPFFKNYFLGYLCNISISVEIVTEI